MWKCKKTGKEVFVKIGEVYTANQDGLPVKLVEQDPSYICTGWRYPVETFEEMQRKAEWVDDEE